MSLKQFHRVFILASLGCLAFVARWASGRNPALLSTPWLMWTSIAGIALLSGYLASSWKKHA